MDDLMSEIGGPPLNPAEVWATAVHEAGHAVALCSYQPGVLETVALRDAGNSSGRTVGRYTPPLEGTALEGDRFLRFLLSGRAAEEEILGNATGGAGGGVESDLGRATHFAVHAYAAHGMDPAGGLVWRGEPSRHAVADVLASDRAMSDRVQARLEEAYAAARAFVREHMTTVLAVAKLLARKRVVDAPEIEEIYRGQ
jgi:ATP-dependent Zn protease